ncbi:hypothetical protein [Flavobacterium sp. ASW18X]|uniref:hypothetical protein n=1 Tax=Flavobacterium sp. ASW18X TaxID=2572595 RepID=UPI0010AED786|nr:hypothetical protein [Flavobacterium sp. ASW18X]TKD59144.1 hypothetical protein FBT53_14035 [Flavobacterium sp. ASW18X]
MKDKSMSWVLFTTLLLVTLTLLASFNVSFSIIFYLTVAGQAAVIAMVYKVLTDKHTTTYTFKDGYADQPLKSKL